MGLLAALAALALTQAPEDDPFKRDLKLLCDAERLSGAGAIKDPAKRASKIADYVFTHELSEDFRDFFSHLGGELPCDKPARLREEAKKHGLARCAFADSSEREAGPRCSRKASLKADLELLCGAEKPSGALKHKDPVERFQAVSAYVLTHRLSDEFQAFFHKLTEADLCAQGAMLREQVQAALVAKCPLAERWEKEPCPGK